MTKSNTDRIRNHLRKHGSMSSTSLRAALKLPPKTFFRALYSVKRSGDIKLTGARGKARVVKLVGKHNGTAAVRRHVAAAVKRQTKKPNPRKAQPKRRQVKMQPTRPVSFEEHIDRFVAEIRELAGKLALDRLEHELHGR